MKKIDWFIIKSYVVPFIITFFIAEFVLVSQFVFVYLDDLVGKGVGVAVILELLFLVAAHLIPMALPLAILLSSIMAMGNIGERSELTAMKSMGLSIYRIMRPLLVLMIFISIGSFFFSNYVWGKVHLRQRILIGDIQNTKLALVLKDNVFFTEIDNFSIRASKINKETNELTDVLIYEYNPTYNFRKVVRSENGIMSKSDDGDFILVTLYNGQITEVINPGANPFEDKSVLPHQQTSFKETTFKIDVSSMGLVRSDEEDYQQMFQFQTLNTLGKAIDSLELRYDTIRQTVAHYYENSHLVSRVKESYAMDTIQEVNFKFDQLNVYEQKSALNNAKNRLKNSLSYIQNREEEFKNKRKYLSGLEVEWHRKLTLSLACIVLFFIGAPLGAIVKKGGFGIPIAIAIVMFIIYYIISIVGERLAESLVIPPYIGMWLSSIVLLPLGALLTYQVVSENKIFRFAELGSWLKGIFSFKKKKKA